MSRAARAAVCGSVPTSGAWRSLVAHPAGGRAVGGSNPLAPITWQVDLPATPSLALAAERAHHRAPGGAAGAAGGADPRRRPDGARGAAIFVAVAATDLLDGYLARRLDAETRVRPHRRPAGRPAAGGGRPGRADPARPVPRRAPIILIARDVLVDGGVRRCSLRRGIEMRVDMAGKISLRAHDGGRRRRASCSTSTWVDVLMWAAVALALATFAQLRARGGRCGCGARPRPGHEGWRSRSLCWPTIVHRRGAPMDAQPDLTQLTDAELKDLIRQLTEEEREVSMQRRCCTGASSS